MAPPPVQAHLHERSEEVAKGSINDLNAKSQDVGSRIHVLSICKLQSLCSVTIGNCRRQSSRANKPLLLDNVTSSTTTLRRPITANTLTVREPLCA